MKVENAPARQDENQDSSDNHKFSAQLHLRWRPRTRSAQLPVACRRSDPGNGFANRQCRSWLSRMADASWTVGNERSLKGVTTSRASLRLAPGSWLDGDDGPAAR